MLLYAASTFEHQALLERGDSVLHPWRERHYWVIRSPGPEFARRWASRIAPPDVWLDQGAFVLVDRGRTTLRLPHPEDVHEAMSLMQWLVAATLATQEMEA